MDTTGKLGRGDKVPLAAFGLIYGNSEVARREILHQLYSFLDRSSAKAVEDIAASAGDPSALRSLARISDGRKES